ncbi:MAG: hypothetical protein ABIO74_07415 [Dokdonella sp.]
MRNSGKAPTMMVWVISLVLFVIAVAAQFGVIALGAAAPWLWIIGYALLLAACQIRGL